MTGTHCLSFFSLWNINERFNSCFRSYWIKGIVFLQFKKNLLFFLLNSFCHIVVNHLYFIWINIDRFIYNLFVHGFINTYTFQINIVHVDQYSKERTHFVHACPMRFFALGFYPNFPPSSHKKVLLKASHNGAKTLKRAN